ncbi:tetratricopeptide repeat protein, partial [Chloroflexota bacterium]
VDFTYLSKIESGVVPPPSEKVIFKLAETLNTDRDDLIITAGKIPSDIAEMLKNRETLQFLRSDHSRKKVTSTTKKEGGFHLLDDFKEATKAHKSFARIAAATVMTIVVGITLWFALPFTDTAVTANNQGLIYNNKGEYLKAIEAFTKAIDLDPDLALAFNNRGWSYIELGQYEQAIADCNQAIELEPDLALAHSNRGRAYIELGQYEQAITDFDKAMALDPNLQK